MDDPIAKVAAEIYAKEMDVQSRYLNKYGQERPNPVPMAPPIGYKRPISIADQIREAIRAASFEAYMAGAETEEEANDFAVGEDEEPSSRWESEFEIDPTLEAMLALQSAPPAKPSGGGAPKADPSSPPEDPAPPSAAKTGN